MRDGLLWFDFRLYGLVIEFLGGLFIFGCVESDTTLLLKVLRSLKFGHLLQKALVDSAALQELGDEVFVYDVAHELLTADNAAVTEFKVLNHY
jgi:hypothetical protein